MFTDIGERLTLDHMQVDHFKVQLLSEHGSFQTYLFRFGILEDNLCNGFQAVDQYIMQLKNVQIMKTNEKLQSNESYNSASLVHHPEKHHQLLSSRKIIKSPRNK